MLFVVGSVETIEILPLPYLPELDLLLHEAVLSSDPCVCPGLHCCLEEPLISPRQSYGSSKLSQHATKLFRGGSRSWLTSGDIRGRLGLAFTRENKKGQS